MKIAVVSQSDSLLQRSTVQEGIVDSWAVHACIKWTYLQTDFKKSTLGILGKDMLGCGQEASEASKIRRCLHWPWVQAGICPRPRVGMVHGRVCRDFLLWCAAMQQTIRNFCGCWKLVFQFDHESAGLWAGLSENGWLFNAASVGVAC